MVLGADNEDLPLIKRTLEISREPAHLTVQHGQLLLKRQGQVVGQVPCEDIGVVLVDQPQTSYSHAALAALAESDAVLVVCGRNHLPVAVLLPLADHSQIVWRLKDQLSVTKPLRKRNSGRRASSDSRSVTNLSPGPIRNVNISFTTCPLSVTNLSPGRQVSSTTLRTRLGQVSTATHKLLPLRPPHPRKVDHNSIPASSSKIP